MWHRRATNAWTHRVLVAVPAGAGTGARGSWSYGRRGAVRRLRRRAVPGPGPVGVPAGARRRVGRGPGADGADEGMVRLGADRGPGGVRAPGHGDDLDFVVAPALGRGDPV